MTMRDITFNGTYPVARFSSVSARGIDETRAAFRRLVREHEILSFGDNRCHAEISYAPLSNMAVSSVSLSTGITARAYEAQDSTLIFTLLDGEIEITMGGGRFNVRKNRIVIVPAGVPFSLDIPRRNRSIIVEIDQDHLGSFVSQELGTACRDLMALNLDADASESRAGVAGLIRFLRNELNDGSPQLRHAAYVSRMEDLIASSLSFALPQASARGEIRCDQKSMPRYIRRTIEYMHAHADAPPTLETLSQVAAISPRTLIRGFNRFMGQSPIAYLRDLRLECAHKDLCRAHPHDVSVTAIAHKWNFCHVGRFTALYRQKFGESPAESLRKQGHRLL